MLLATAVQLLGNKEHNNHIISPAMCAGAQPAQPRAVCPSPQAVQVEDVAAVQLLVQALRLHLLAADDADAVTAGQVLDGSIWEAVHAGRHLPAGQITSWQGSMDLSETIRALRWRRVGRHKKLGGTRKRNQRAAAPAPKHTTAEAGAHECASTGLHHMLTHRESKYQQQLLPLQQRY